MFAKPQRTYSTNNLRNSNYYPRKKTTPTAPKGLLADGVWHCECKPRLPAERFQVKKEGKNKGRWFYTCQQEPKNRCGFFLWAEEAQKREAKTVLSNSRTETRVDLPDTSRTETRVHPHTPRTGKGLYQEPQHTAPRVHAPHTPRTESQGNPVHSRGMFDGVSMARVQFDSASGEETSDFEVVESPSRGAIEARVAMKRTAREAGFTEDDDFDGDFSLDASDVDALLADSTLATPAKAAKQTAYATPDTTVNRDRRQMIGTINPPPFNMQMSRFDELMTPAKTPRSLYGATSDEAAPHTPSKSTSQPQPQVSTPDRPISVGSEAPATTQRYIDALADPDDSNSAFVAEVLAELAPHTVPASTLTKIRSILSQYELRAEGVKKGRETTRLALKSRNEEIDRLRTQIQSLETQMHLDRALHTSNKAVSLRR